MSDILEAAGREHNKVVETLAQAFHRDPALSYILQNESSRQSRLKRLFDLIVADDARVGRVMQSAGNEAAALWRAPGKADSGDEPLIAQLIPMLRIFGLALPRAMRVVEGIDKHRPKGDFWYLHFVGVRPAHQGKGWGGRIIREGLSRADGDDLPCWLETATPENVPLYQRLGFVIQCEWDVPKGGPHFWGMMREAA